MTFFGTPGASSGFRGPPEVSREEEEEEEEGEESRGPEGPLQVRQPPAPGGRPASLDLPGSHAMPDDRLDDKSHYA